MLLEKLSFNVCSQDKWTLSYYSAKDTLVNMGLKEKEIAEVIDLLKARQLLVRSKNKISGMF